MLGNLPEIPSAGVKHVTGESEVGDGVSEDALREAAGFVENDAVDSTGHDAGKNEVMLHNRTLSIASRFLPIALM